MNNDNISEISGSTAQSADLTNALNDKFIQAFQSMLGDRAMMFQLIDIFPYPIQVFAPDGFLLFANRAICEDSNVANLNEAIGLYNILQDPVTLDVLGLRESVEAVFKGERRTVHDVRIPYEDISAKFTQIDDQFNKVKYQDITGFQLWDEQGNIACIIMIFITKQTYTGRTEMIKAREYIEKHWREDFNRDKIAEAIHMNPNYFSGLFKEFAGVSPQEFYTRVKVEKIRENLLDPNMSISEAFAACGVDYNGKYKQYFKEIIGSSPSEYRDSKTRKK